MTLRRSQLAEFHRGSIRPSRVLVRLKSLIWVRHRKPSLGTSHLPTQGAEAQALDQSSVGQQGQYAIINAYYLRSRQRFRVCQETRECDSDIVRMHIS